MSEVGELRHEIVEEEGTGLPVLHVYLPEGLAFSDVAVTTGSSPDVAEVFIELIATERIIGLIALPGYAIAQDDSVAKFNKKHRRYAMRLSQVASEVASVVQPPAAVGVEGTMTAASGDESAPPAKRIASPAAQMKPSGSTMATAAAAAPTSPPPALTGNIFDLLDNDDVSDDDGDGDREAAASVGKKKKKKKKGKKANAVGEGQGETKVLEVPIANGNHTGGGSSGDEDEAVAAAGGEGASGAAKKKKKKKKKGAASSTAAAGVGTAVGGAEAEVEAAEAALPEEGRSSPPPLTPPEPTASLPSRPVPASAPAPPSAPAAAPLAKSVSRALSVDMVEDFGEKQLGVFEVGAAVPHDPLLGPAVFNALGKVQVKGEDKWLEAPTNAWSVGGIEGAATPVSAFGIFDGHGGRMAAQHTAKQLLPLVARFAERAVGPDASTNPEQLVAEGYIAPEQAEEAEELKRARVAAVQDALIARLPKALHAGFVQCDEDVISRHKASGTTATLAIQVGWELLVANVGDSLAYLDTGSEIVVLSANHRVSESAEEQNRILQAGGRIKPAMYDEDDDPVDGSAGSATPREGQQLRVWPGGINMTRTIGDEAASGLLIAEPAVRQISLPVTGARLIIASDGLWDAVNAKTIIGQLRTCNAREAASKAAVYAMRSKKHDDDVTVVVADFVPRPSDTHVPGLLKRASGPVAAALAALAAAGMKEERAAQSWRPLETPSESWRERHRAHRRRAAAYLQQLDLAEKAEAEEAEELERQKRAAVAPAAGTAGIGTAVRLPAVSDTYRELAELKVNVEALDDEPAADWTQVDPKKKKDDSGGFDLRKELMKVARPGEVKPPRSPGGGGGREERTEPGGRRERRGRGGTDRERRPPRREHDGSAGDATVAPAAAPAANSEPNETVELLQQPEQQQPRGERRERVNRRERGGRGGRGREGAAAGGRSGGSTATAEAAEPGSGASAPSPTVLSGVVKADGYLYVPRSLLAGGGMAAAATTATAATEAAADTSGATVEGSGGGAGTRGKPRRDRVPRGGGRNRGDGAAPSTGAVQDSAGGVEAALLGADDAATPAMPNHRNQQRRRQREAEVAAGSIPAAVRAAAPPAHVHVATTSSNDPIVVLEPASGHHQRRPPYGVSQPAQVPQPMQAPRDTAAATLQYSSSAQSGSGGQTAAAPPAAPAAAPVAAHFPPAQQHKPPQHRALAAAPPPPAVPSYAGPMDFGAGFGPGSSMWPPSGGGGQYGGFSANGGAAVPKHPPGLATGPPQRSADEVAAAAAAAAAAAVARKAAAARGGGGQYAQGRS
ncbi:hypothetical protein PLESTB_001409100 [Pleodorina starrii]|uniref:PPM-type phosphatase domain-containing protein n=1 Tax=Pleodorina starrii TaxID=330485 RepID=A0A9W6BVA3_9CHLO|nr:hypothetical protein PLESTB_001409100 [Pleodorina starrii]GLC68042.1 hypothetical protein PLESTF_000638700 [Pleodorina starrii]